MALIHFARYPSQLDGLGYDACGATWITPSITPAEKADLHGKPVFAFVGEYDMTVKPASVAAGVKELGRIVGSDKIATDYSKPAGHTWLSRLYGSPKKQCSKSSPLQNCDNYDLAGNILKHVYPGLKTPLWSAPNEGLYWLSQSAYTGEQTPKQIGAHSHAGVYVSDKCRKKPSACKIHVHYHGCHMGVGNKYELKYRLGSSVIKRGGFNNWALANDVIVLYPQVLECWFFLPHNAAKHNIFWSRQKCIGASNPQLVMVQGMINDLQTGDALDRLSVMRA